jgi:hypothetical protein
MQLGHGRLYEQGHTLEFAGGTDDDPCCCDVGTNRCSLSDGSVDLSGYIFFFFISVCGCNIIYFLSQIIMCVPCMLSLSELFGFVCTYILSQTGQLRGFHCIYIFVGYFYGFACI